MHDDGADVGLHGCRHVGTSSARSWCRSDARPRSDLLGDDCDGIELPHHLRVPTLCIAQDDAADELLGRDPLALLLGMLLDQHMHRRSSGA